MIARRLALFALLIGPIMGFPALLNSLSYAQASARRILNLLNAPELQSYVTSSQGEGQPAIKVVNGNFGWLAAPVPAATDAGPAATDAGPADAAAAADMSPAATHDELRSSHTLVGINVQIERGSFIGVVGGVGCGKSSFLSMLLGEMAPTTGSSGAVVMVNGHTAYHQQAAWIVNATIRDNILFQTPYDEARFSRVLKDTCLDSDILALPGGTPHNCLVRTR